MRRTPQRRVTLNADLYEHLVTIAHDRQTTLPRLLWELTELGHMIHACTKVEITASMPDGSVVSLTCTQTAWSRQDG